MLPLPGRHPACWSWRQFGASRRGKRLSAALWTRATIVDPAGPQYLRGWQNRAVKVAHHRQVSLLECVTEFGNNAHTNDINMPERRVARSNKDPI